MPVVVGLAVESQSLSNCRFQFQKVFFLSGAAVADVEIVINRFGEDFDASIEISGSSREVHDLPAEAVGEPWPLDLFAASGTVVASHFTGLMRFEFAFYPLTVLRFFDGV